MNPQAITPAMPPARAQSIAGTLDLRDLPPDFYANPYPVYAALQQWQPVRRMPDGSWLLTRYADLVAVYRDAQAFSSDKKVEFTPKYGAVSPLLAHHTTSLVFNDPPLHTRVRKLIMGALTRRPAARLVTRHPRRTGAAPDTGAAGTWQPQRRRVRRLPARLGGPSAQTPRRPGA